MDDVNASAIQLNNTLSQNNHSNKSPQHPDSQTASEYVRTFHKLVIALILRAHYV